MIDHLNPYFNPVLSPAELLLLKDFKQPKIKEILEYTFYDLLLRNFLELEEKKAMNDLSGRAFFLKAGALKHNDRDIKPHEKILLKICSKNPEWTSLKEFVIRLSDYNNEKFRCAMPEYIYEKYVLESLITRDLCQEKRQRFLVCFYKRTTRLTDMGLRMQEKIRHSSRPYQSDHDWIVHRYFDFMGKEAFFLGSSFEKLKNTFNSYFWDGLKKIAYTGIGKYPKPANS